ncbi:MAG: ATP-binding protein [Desulfobulbaceae bacterium]|nr:ATP-binding protein [Desulfobulbaceae bacterium]
MTRWGPFQAIRGSFIAKTSITLIAGIIVLAVLFDLLLIRLQQRAYEQDNIKHGLFLSGLLAQSVKIAVYTENEHDFVMPVKAIMVHKDVIEIDIFSNEGVMLYSRKKQGDCLSQVLDNPEHLGRIFKSIEESGEMYWQAEDCFIFWRAIYFNIAVGSEENLYFDGDGNPPGRELIGYVALVISKQSFRAGVRHILVSTGIIVVCFLVAGIAMSFFVVRKMFKPLSSILQKVREHTGQDGVGDDLSQLSVNYGGMIRELEQSFATIKELKEGLEKKVAERTKELSARQLQLESANLRLAKTLVKLQEAQQQLIQSEKMAAMGQMVAGVAHEINNSVNFISGALPSVKRLLGNLKKLLAGYKRLEEMRDIDDRDRNIAEISSLKNDIEFDMLFGTLDHLLANIEEGTERTTRIIKDLNVFARHGPEKFQQTDIHAVIDSTIPFINVDGKLLKGVEIRKEFGDIELVSCLAGRISQVFLNIMQNAVHAMKGEGTLTIRTWQEDDQAHVSFTDTGCGIEEDVINRIFDPFFTTKEVGEGIGLGLGISYNIIRQHNGSITVASKVGQGAVFEVILPLSPAVFPAKTGG